MKMRKIACLFIAALFTLSCAAGFAYAGAPDASGLWHPESADWTPIEKGDDVLARFAIGGDTHLDSYYSTGKLPAAYEAFGKIGGVDAFIIAGDLTDAGRPDQYDKLMAIVNKYTASATVDVEGSGITATGSAVGTTIMSMGNHDELQYDDGVGSHALFTEKTGQIPQKLYWVCGVPIIKMSPDEAPDGELTYNENEEFVLSAFAEIDATGYTGPILGIAHHPINTPFKEQTDYYTDAVIEAFRAHPNLIFFTGHSHTLLYDTARVIYQGAGFTQIRTGTLGNTYGATNAGSAKNAGTGTTDAPYADSVPNSCQCLLVDVLKNGTVRVRRLDINLGKQIFENEEFIIDPANQIRADGSAYYVTDRAAGSYGEKSAAPKFPADAEVTVEDVGNHDSILVTTTRANPKSDLARDYVWRYQVVLTDPEGNETTYNYMNDLHIVNRPEKLTFKLVGLTQGVDYTVKVRAQTAYKKSSSWINAEGTINVGVLETKYPAEAIFEVMADSGSYEETHGRTVNEEPARTTFVEDASTGKTSVRLLGLGGIGYSFTQEDFNKIKYATTLEAFFKLSNNQTAQCILGSIDSANIALRVDSGNLFLWGTFVSNADHASTDRVIVTAPVPQNKWVHAVAVYDGLSIKLYLNGELVGEGKGTGGIRDPYFPDDPYGGSMWVGSMSFAKNPNGEVILPVSARTEINLARVYEGAMTADDVAAAYRAATAKKASAIFTDVKKGAYYEDAVSWAVANGITNGTSPTEFSPEKGCTRGQVVTFLWRAAGSPEPDSAVNPFKDVKSGDYYYKAVLWAVGKGITLGTSKTEFSPKQTCTRGQIVTFLHRSEGSPAPSSTDNPFDDVKDSDYYFAPVLWSVEHGITNGVSKTKFSPSNTCTRSQVVTFLFRNVG
ncbi:MAG: S-layer homology domain-containing protein [Clostridia bacterium]|nr:S-layer homology domain-containing protein [Clostridia bacterium]